MTIVAVVMLALVIGQVQATTITVPNGDFELLYKPGTAITGNVSAGGWSQGVGPECPIDSGNYDFSDTSTGTDADISGWLGYDRDGWIARGGTYGRDQTTGNLQGCVANVANRTPGGLNCYCVNGGGWGNQAGGLITSDASLGSILSNSIYTLSMYAQRGATPVVLELLADGVVVTPISSVSPVEPGTWAEFTRTYDVADLSSYAFPQGVTFSGNETILITRGDPAQFRSTYGIGAGIDIYGPYPGSLDNAGEKVTLIQPGSPDPITLEVPEIRIDRVNYDPAWYPTTDGGGDSLTRKVLANYGNDIDNWQAASPTRGY